MPYEIAFENLPLGYAAEASKAHEEVVVIAKEFVSSEDGLLFVRRLEGFPNQILELVRPQRNFSPSEIDHILAIFRCDKSCTVYVNEIDMIGEMRVRKSVEKGSLVYKDDILDVGPLKLTNINLPPDAGILFVFSAGWRKGIYLDLMPIGPGKVPRSEDLESLFGQLYRYVFFQERLSISDSEWDNLFAAGWFPFSALREHTTRKLLTAVTSKWPICEILGDITTDVDESLDSMLASWSNHPAFQSHMEILRNAISRYRASDFISCISTLMTRIEGILRSHRQFVMPVQSSSGRIRQSTLASAAASGLAHDKMSLLLPERFSQFLNEVYFADFDPADQDIAVSRNSVGHGVASETMFTKEAAVRSILVLHQLFYTFGSYGVGPTSEQVSGSEDERR